MRKFLYNIIYKLFRVKPVVQEKHSTDNSSDKNFEKEVEEFMKKHEEVLIKLSQSD